MRVLKMNFILNPFVGLVIFALAPFSSAQAKDFDFAHFKCSRRDTRLLTQVRFYYDQSNHLTGEVDVYSTDGAQRTFVSGDMLYQPQYIKGSITGSTGDLDADTETFKLTPLKLKKNGLWRFLATANGEKILAGNFNCSYPDDVYP